MVKKNFALSEIQSMLDIAGVATIENLINYGYLKDEIVAIDEHNKIDSRFGEEFFKDYEKQIKSEYIGLLSFNPQAVDSYTIEKQKAYFEISSWGGADLEQKRFLKS